VNTIQERASKYVSEEINTDIVRIKKTPKERAFDDFVVGGEYVDSLLRPVIEHMEQKVMTLQNQLQTAVEWARTSHHQDKCNNRNGKNCTCGKFAIEDNAITADKLSRAVTK